MRAAFSRPDAALRVPDWEMASLIGLVGFYFVNGVLFGADGSSQANLLGPLFLSGVLGLSATRIVFLDRRALWTAVFWARVTTVIYFGLGSVAYEVMNPETRGYTADFYLPSDAEISKFNLLVAVCVLTILSTVKLGRSIAPARQAAPSPPRDRRLFGVAVAFFAVGYGFKYLLVVPSAIGAFGDIVIPGIITTMTLIAPVSLFMLCVWGGRRSRGVLVAAVAFGLIDCLVGALQFSKADALLPLLLLMLALLQFRVTLLRISLVVVVSVFAFQFLQPAITYGREALGERYGGTRAGSLSERFGVLYDYLTDDSQAFSDASDLQISLARIAYLHAAVPAIAFYDAGQPGDTFANLPYLLVPRLLWPEKPIFDGGVQYTMLINGSDTSSTGMGYFAEAYWNLGWLGVPAVMMPLGLVFLLSGRYAIWVIRDEQWVHLPMVFIAMRIGIRMDGEIAGDIAFQVLLMLLAYPFLQLATTLVDSVVDPANTRIQRLHRDEAGARGALASMRRG